MNKQIVERDADGRKMYPDRFWEWPTDLPPIDTYDGQMEYGMALWTNTTVTMPSVRQLKYLLYLMDTSVGVPNEIDWSSKRQLARVIDWLLRQPMKSGCTDFTGRRRAE